jgi:hypothetical protein
MLGRELLQAVGTDTGTKMVDDVDPVPGMGVLRYVRRECDGSGPNAQATRRRSSAGRPAVRCRCRAPAPAPAPAPGRVPFGPPRCGWHRGHGSYSVDRGNVCTGAYARRATVNSELLLVSWQFSTAQHADWARAHPRGQPRCGTQPPRALHLRGPVPRYKGAGVQLTFTGGWTVPYSVRHTGPVMIYWQTVLIDERPDQQGLRWPPSWAAGADYVHRSGPVLMRGTRGREYLTSDVVYTDLANVMSLVPTNDNSPFGSRPSHVVKRLYPLDPYNRSFAFSVVLRIPSDPEFQIWRYMENLPAASEAIGCTVKAEEIAKWVTQLKILFNPRKQIYCLYEVGDALGAHLRLATQGGAKVVAGEKFSAIGNAILFSTGMCFVSEPSRGPDLVVDKPPGVRGRPFVALASSKGSFAARRRLRTYALRTFAEIDIANYLYGHFTRHHDQLPEWFNVRAAIAVDYLSRVAPYGLSGEAGRRMWQLSVSRSGAKVGPMRRLARDRLSSVLAPTNPGRSAGNIIVMGDNYTFHGPVAAAGRNAQGILTIGGSPVDATQLARELQRLSEYLQDHDADGPDARLLAEAAHEAEQGDVDAAHGKLRRISRRALKAANDLTLAVAGAVIAHAIGLA